MHFKISRRYNNDAAGNDIGIFQMETKLQRDIKMII